MNTYDNEYNILKEASDKLKKLAPFSPDIAIVLGSGMNDFVDNYKIDKIINYEEIENLPKATVDGHSGKFVFFKNKNKNIICLQGRVHMYEGYDPIEVVRLTRMTGLLGAKKIILTNAAGGIDKNLTPGDLMMITDQINLFVKSPLMGKNIDELGTRFPDMSNLYDDNIKNIIRNEAKNNKIDLKEGIYVQLNGPHFETKADIRALSLLGASSVAMSTGIEAIAAHHMGMIVAGFSYISNMATGLGTPVTHEQLLKNSKNTVDKLIKIFDGMVDKI